jgi:hypothetical protein
MNHSNNNLKDVEAPASTITKPPFNASVIFFILLTAAALSYHYNAIIFSPPQSIHRWRQTDGASVARNYYQHGIRFFKPETPALTSDGGTTGYSAGEFPCCIILCLTIQNIRAHDSVFPYFQHVTVLLRPLCPVQIIMALYNDVFHAGVIPVLIFTSPVFSITMDVISS